MKNYTRIEPTSVYEVGEKFKRSVVVKRFISDDGMSHEFTTFMTEGSQAVAVVALTTDDKVIISRQFRAGRERYVNDLPGGGVEPGEDLEIAAKRELLEESGYRPSSMRYLGEYSWDAYSNLTSHYFIATGCVRDEEFMCEQIEVDQGLNTVLISIDELVQNACNNQVTDAAAVLMANDELTARIKKQA